MKYSKTSKSKKLRKPLKEWTLRKKEKNKKKKNKKTALLTHIHTKRCTLLNKPYSNCWKPMTKRNSEGKRKMRKRQITYWVKRCITAGCHKPYNLEDKSDIFKILKKGEKIYFRILCHWNYLPNKSWENSLPVDLHCKMFFKKLFSSKKYDIRKKLECIQWN